MSAGTASGIITIDTSEAVTNLQALQNALSQVSTQMGTLSSQMGSTATAGASSMTQMSEDVSTADDEMVANNQALSSSFATMGTTMSAMGMMAVTSIMGLSMAQESLLNSQERISTATESYQLALRNYGQNSIQATQAQQNLEMAQRSAAVSQAQYNLQLTMMAMMLLPQIITQLPKLAQSLAQVSTMVQEGTADWATYATVAGLAVSLATLGIGTVIALGSYAAIQNSTNNIQSTQTYNLYGQTDLSNYNNQQAAYQQSASGGH